MLVATGAVQPLSDPRLDGRHHAGDLEAAALFLQALPVQLSPSLPEAAPRQCST